MRIKLFEQFEDIRAMCQKYDIVDYTINPDGTIDVHGNVYLNGLIGNIPLQFGKVTGEFEMLGSGVKSLVGSPREVGGSFNCRRCDLKTLEGAPEIVGRDFDCSYNRLENLIGMPKNVGSIDFSSNFILKLDGLPEGCQIIGLHGNPIYEIFKVFGSLDKFLQSMDWEYIGDRRKIIRYRFSEACEEMGVKMPEYINYYTYV